ncbi:hypothetical protein CFE70_008366 [Pyrenophora teres f. teres 0-1]|uniref:Uncharacterized protein n=2 Tax=Pyrenophora teres f. teres TaxID=97479 RepID=E3RTD7_PYRTT|nr:hypothetical protein PTT_12255 [Pyrenophora teres f. teres 0-1]KAE8830239.1 hypothetical protein HRS9139_06863 [Pyrenophora teres f. teres]KAE8859522.1 hypothetical protein PTNB29_06753 [Pyrenophora teres f. teres]CAE7202045.1 hypothetical protein PTTW11_08962 [Pyrenophora teres f. teres]
MSIPAEPTPADKRHRSPLFDTLPSPSAKLTVRPSERERTSRIPSPHTPPEGYSDSDETIEASPKEMMAYRMYILPNKPEEAAVDGKTAPVEGNVGMRKTVNKGQKAKEKRLLKKTSQTEVKAKTAEGSKGSVEEEKAKEAEGVEESREEEETSASESELYVEYESNEGHSNTSYVKEEAESPTLDVEHESNEDHSNDSYVEEEAKSPTLDVDAVGTARRASLQAIIPPPNLVITTNHRDRIIGWLQNLEKINSTASSTTQASTIQEAYDAGFHEGLETEQKKRQSLLETAACKGYEHGQKAASSISKADLDAIARRQGYNEGYIEGLEEGAARIIDEMKCLLGREREMGYREGRAAKEIQAHADIRARVSKQEEQLKLARGLLRYFCKTSDDGDEKGHEEEEEEEEKEEERRRAIERVKKMGWMSEGGGALNGGNSGNIDRDDEKDDDDRNATANDNSDGNMQMAE